MRVQRQAVVVVHGIGEQVPLETLRGLVLGDGPAADPARGGVVLGSARVFSEASPAPASCRDRIYTARWIHDSDVLQDELRTKRSAADQITRGQLSGSDVMTDFFEYYWAPRFRDTTFGDVATWAFKLVKRPRRSYSSARIVGPPSLKRFVPHVLVAVALGVAAAGSIDLTSPWLAGPATLVLLATAIVVAMGLGLLTAFRTLIVAAIAALVAGLLILGASTGAAVVSFLGSAVFSGVLAVAGRAAARTVGDAARYLSNGANSAEESDLLQTGVLALLDQLHDLREPDRTFRYERIVVIGHSLGGVIAYDAVTLLWQRRHRHLRLPEAGSGTLAGVAARTVEDKGTAIYVGSGANPPETVPRRSLASSTSRSNSILGQSQDEEAVERPPDAIAGFREAQRTLATALRNPAGRPDRTASFADLKSASPAAIRWIITDLITLGAPLTYADAFLAVDATRLRERFEERSLQQCPPVTQQSVGAEKHPYRTATPPPSRGGAPSTFLHQGAAFALVRWSNRWFHHDVVGGPVAPHFGYGVDDKALAGTKTWLGWALLANAHSSYWRFGRRSANDAGTDECRRLLHESIYRPPVYVMTTSLPVDDELLRQLVGLLDPPAVERSEIEVAVRLQAGSRRGTRVPVFLPLDTAPLPSARCDTAIESLLGQPTELVFGDDPLGTIQPSFPIARPT